MLALWVVLGPQSFSDTNMLVLATLTLGVRPNTKPQCEWFRHAVGYTGLGRGPYGGRHFGSCPPSGPQFQTRGWTSTTFAHCKLTNFIFIIAYDCFRNTLSTKLNIFLGFCLHNVVLRFSENMIHS